MAIRRGPLVSTFNSGLFRSEQHPRVGVGRRFRYRRDRSQRLRRGVRPAVDGLVCAGRDARRRLWISRSRGLRHGNWTRRQRRRLPSAQRWIRGRRARPRPIRAVGNAGRPGGFARIKVRLTESLQTLVQRRRGRVGRRIVAGRYRARSGVAAANGGNPVRFAVARIGRRLVGHVRDRRTRRRLDAGSGRRQRRHGTVVGFLQPTATPASWTPTHSPFASPIFHQRETGRNRQGCQPSSSPAGEPDQAQRTFLLGNRQSGDDSTSSQCQNGCHEFAVSHNAHPTEGVDGNCLHQKFIKGYRKNRFCLFSQPFPITRLFALGKIGKCMNMPAVWPLLVYGLKVPSDGECWAMSIAWDRASRHGKGRPQKLLNVRTRCTR